MATMVNREQKESIVTLSHQIIEDARIARRAFGDDAMVLRAAVCGDIPVLAIGAYRESEALAVALEALGAPIDVDATFAREMGQRRWSLLQAAVGRRR